MTNDISRLIKDAWNKGDPTGWFEQVYARAESGEGVIPWAYMQPNPHLVEWLERKHLLVRHKQALVIGCGLGDDAEALAKLGFGVTAFDIAETAIRRCKERFPDSMVEYRVANLLAPPDAWGKKFDFVLESRTIQSLPYTLFEQATGAIAGFVAAEGHLLVMCAGREPDQERRGIPWPLSRVELDVMKTHGLTEKHFEEFIERGARQFRVEYQRTA